MDTPRKIVCLIIDDEPPAQEILKKYVAEVPSLELAGICNNAIEALPHLQSRPIDLLFLDIQMPGLPGTTFIRTLANPPKVIFTTAFRKFALEGFELNAVDYLLKPISFGRFITAVNRVLQLQITAGSNVYTNIETESVGNQSFLYIRANRRMVKVLYDEILYIESLKDYLKIVTPDKTIISRSSISSMEEMLPKNAFLRIHRSYIVAINKVESFNGESVDVSKNELPIGRLFRHEVNLRLSGN
jgi:DNA-binding LytR/AlgR family response regulator